MTDIRPLAPDGRHIAVIAFGHDQYDSVRFLQPYLGGLSFWDHPNCVNVKKYLERDPISLEPGRKSRHHQNGRYSVTQRSVIGARGFPRCMEICTEVIMRDERLRWLGLFCKGGNHRACVTTRFIVDHLSRITDVAGPDGKRLFNVKLFTMNECKRGQSEVKIRRMMDWAYNNPTLVPFNMDQPRYAFNAFGDPATDIEAENGLRNYDLTAEKIAQTVFWYREQWVTRIDVRVQGTRLVPRARRRDPQSWIRNDVQSANTAEAGVAAQRPAESQDAIIEQAGDGSAAAASAHDHRRTDEHRPRCMQLTEPPTYHTEARSSNVQATADKYAAMPTSTTEAIIMLGDASAHRSPEGHTEPRSSTVEATGAAVAEMSAPSIDDMGNESIIAFSGPVDGETDNAAEFDLFEEDVAIVADDGTDAFYKRIIAYAQSAREGPPPIEDLRKTRRRFVFGRGKPPRRTKKATRDRDRSLDRDDASSYADDASVSGASTCRSRSSGASLASWRAVQVRRKKHADRDAKTNDIFETWYEIIMENDGDALIMAEACLLAQFSDKAYRKVNILIHTLSTKGKLRNPPGYLHSEMQKIRHAVEEEMGIETTLSERKPSGRSNVHNKVDGTQPSNQSGPSRSRDAGAWRGDHRSSNPCAWRGDQRSSGGRWHDHGAQWSSEWSSWRGR